MLRNAFVSAFARSLEGSITLRDVKKNLDEIDPNQESDGEKNQGGDPEGKVAQKPKAARGPAGKT